MRFLKFYLIQLEKAVRRSNDLKTRFCDTCALNSWRYEIFEVFPHTVVISRTTVK